jgi:hypothetical protein
VPKLLLSQQFVNFIPIKLRREQMNGSMARKIIAETNWRLLAVINIYEINKHGGEKIQR